MITEDDDDDDDESPSSGSVQNPVANVQQPAQVQVEEAAGAADYPVGDSETTIYDEVGTDVDGIQNGVDLSPNDPNLKDPNNDIAQGGGSGAILPAQATVQQVVDDDGKFSFLVFYSFNGPARTFSGYVWKNILIER